MDVPGAGADGKRRAQVQPVAICQQRGGRRRHDARLGGDCRHGARARVGRRAGRLRLRVAVGGRADGDGLARARPAAGRFRQLLVPLHQRPAGVHAVGAGCFYARVLLPSAGGLDDIRLLVLVGFPGGEVEPGARVCLCARARPAQGRARLLCLYGSDRRDERERLGQPNHLHGGHGLQRRRMASSGCRLRAEDRPGRVGHGPACSPTRPARRDTSRRASRRSLARS